MAAADVLQDFLPHRSAFLQDDLEGLCTGPEEGLLCAL